MIYTIGHQENYQEAIDKQGTIFKIGKKDDYVGGYVFKTVEDAQRRIDEKYIKNGFIIWGLDADWEKDTYPNPDGGWWRNLINDSQIIPLNQKCNRRQNHENSIPESSAETTG